VVNNRVNKGSERDELSEETINKALKEGILEDAYKEISEIREKMSKEGKESKEDVKQTQARKILEEARKVKDKADKKKLKNSIIRILLLLEYQYKRGVIKENMKKNYELILKSALKLVDESNPEELGKNLYDLIEMLTIKFYEREKSGR